MPLSDVDIRQIIAITMIKNGKEMQMSVQD